MMYFSRITIKQDAVISGEFLRKWSYDGAGTYQIHKMVWSLYSDPYSNDQKRDFLYRADLNSGRPVIYTVSEREPLDQYNLLNIETKPYNPMISDGMTFGFTLRANPIVKKTAPIKNGVKLKQSRHDVVMDAKRRIREESGKDIGAISMNELVQNEGFGWLNTRSERCGFSIREGDVRVDTYTQVSFKHGNKSGNNNEVKNDKASKNDKCKYISYSTLDYNGVLTVTDKDKFEEALYHGIGPAKGFGCGLMMIRHI